MLHGYVILTPCNFYLDLFAIFTVQCEFVWILVINKTHTDDWSNFLERVKCRNEEEFRMKLQREEELKGPKELEEELRLWASYRGQTLTKTGIVMKYILCRPELHK